MQLLATIFLPLDLKGSRKRVTLLRVMSEAKKRILSALLMSICRGERVPDQSAKE